MKDFELPEYDQEMLIHCYEKDKIPDLSADDFIRGITERGAFEGSDFCTGSYLKKNGLFLVNGIWRNYPNCLEFFINEKTHEYIEIITGISGEGGKFNELPNDYNFYRREILSAFEERAKDFYKHNGNTFFPSRSINQDEDHLANLRGPLKFYLSEEFNSL